MWCKWIMWHKICFKMRYCTDLYLIWFWIYCEKHARELGPYPWFAVRYIRSTENLLVLELCEMQMGHVAWNLLWNEVLYWSVPYLVLDLLRKTCPQIRTISLIGNHICQFYRKPKLIHLGSCATNFGDEIIKNLNFQKMVPNGVLGTTFRTPPGTPTGPNVLLVVDNVYLHHPHPD